ncbi:MAG TPA: zinc metallopeptidase [Pseudomonadales bacterium]
MIYLLLALLLIGLLVMPRLAIIHTLKKHNIARADIPGSGGQFAGHLLKRLALADDVSVEAVDGGDHYDPQAKTVRLGRDHFDRHSLAALVVAAHEVGHALQHAENNRWLALRQQLLNAAQLIEKIAPLTLTIAPLLLAVTRSPLLSFVVLAIGFLSIAMTTLLHLLTLPVELDASFNKALPLLVDGNYLPQPDDYPKARTLLRAAALTYVAQSLFNLLNIAYWLRLLRR